MKIKISSKKIVYILYWLWIFSNSFTAVDEFMEVKGTYSNMHIHNILFIPILLLVLGIVLGSRHRQGVPKGFIFIFLFFAEVTFVWLINVSNYGLSSGYISTVYGILIMLCTVVASEYLDYDEVNRMFESVAIIVAFLITCNLFIHIREIISSLKAGWTHPNLRTFFGGGHNLEATWMTMFGVFFRKKWKYIYWMFSIMLSAIYLSRTAILVNVLIFLIYLYQDGKEQLLKRILVLLFLVLLVGNIGYYTGLLERVLSRFLKIGNEAGSNARIIIWEVMWQGIKDKPFGIGCGNTMVFLRESYGLIRDENNAHNIYFQCLLENNIVGLLLLIIGMVKLGIKQIRARFSDSCATFILLYAFQGLFQMQLKEPLLFIVIAFYLIFSGDRKKSRNLEMIK